MSPKFQKAIESLYTKFECLSFLQNTLSEVNFPAPGGCT